MSVWQKNRDQILLKIRSKTFRLKSYPKCLTSQVKCCSYLQKRKNIKLVLFDEYLTQRILLFQSQSENRAAKQVGGPQKSDPLTLSLYIFFSGIFPRVIAHVISPPKSLFWFLSAALNTGSCLKPRRDFEQRLPNFGRRSNFGSSATCQNKVIMVT